MVVWAVGEIYAAVRHFDDAANGPFDMWQEVIDVVEGRVLYELRYRFPDGVELVSQNELRFRTQAELTDALRLTRGSRSSGSSATGTSCACSATELPSSSSSLVANS